MKLLFFFLLSTALFSQSFIKEYTYRASDDDSRTSARKAALSHVKMLAIEEIGVTIRSSFHNYVDVEDDTIKKVINSKIDTVAQNVTHSKILEESWNGKVFYIKAKITINPKEIGREIRKTVAKELHKIKKKSLQKQTPPPVKYSVALVPSATHKTIKTKPHKETKALPSSKLNNYYKTSRENTFSEWMSQEVYQAQYDDGTYKNSYPAYIETNSKGERRVLRLRSASSYIKWSSTSARSLQYIKEVDVRNKMKGKRMLSLHVQHIGSQSFYSAVWVKNSVYNSERKRLEEFGISLDTLNF